MVGTRYIQGKLFCAFIKKVQSLQDWLPRGITEFTVYTCSLTITKLIADIETFFQVQ